MFCSIAAFDPIISLFVLINLYIVKVSIYFIIYNTQQNWTYLFRYEFFYRNYLQKAENIWKQNNKY